METSVLIAVIFILTVAVGVSIARGKRTDVTPVSTKEKVLTVARPLDHTHGPETVFIISKTPPLAGEFFFSFAKILQELHNDFEREKHGSYLRPSNPGR